MPESRPMPDAPYPPGLPAIFEVVRRLREPDGCPWDREQTHESLRQYLLEETYELLEAIDKADDDKIREELGDVLLQVAMHAEIAREAGRFDAEQVSEAAAAKMVSRHPHVFGETEVADAAEVLRNWEHHKAAEAKAAGGDQESVLDRVVAAMPALAWALALQKRAARVGFDFSPAPEGSPVAGFDAMGDLLFAIVAESRRQKINPEDALRAAGQRFAERFKKMERSLAESGSGFRDLSDQQLEELWARSV